MANKYIMMCVVSCLCVMLCIWPVLYYDLIRVYVYYIIGVICYVLYVGVLCVSNACKTHVILLRNIYF